MALDRFTGLKVSMVTDDPPQSGRPSVIMMTPEQHRQLESLAREIGDHQELCKRVYKRVKVAKDKVATLILSTDMARIQDVLKSGEKGKYPDLFREIMNSNPSTGGPTADPDQVSKQADKDSKNH